jgi:hypothetical protein
MAVGFIHRSLDQKGRHNRRNLAFGTGTRNRGAGFCVAKLVRTCYQFDIEPRTPAQKFGSITAPALSARGASSFHGICLPKSIPAILQNERDPFCIFA